MFLEVIAQSVEDIKKINFSQADQIEFCVDIEKEGLSPPVEVVKRACSLAKKKLRVMLRKHFKDFFATSNQIKELVSFVQKTRNLKFAGYVFGVLSKDYTVDFQALSQITKVLKGTTKNLTFHKAFDLVQDKEKEFEKLQKIPEVYKVLTTGGPEGFVDNIELLKKLNLTCSKKILVGGGVNIHNINFLLERGFFNVHIGKSARANNTWDSPVSTEKIREIKNLIAKKYNQAQKEGLNG